jgi:hypothetical protein
MKLSGAASVDTCTGAAAAALDDATRTGFGVTGTLTAALRIPEVVRESTLGVTGKLLRMLGVEGPS